MGMDRQYIWNSGCNVDFCNLEKCIEANDTINFEFYCASYKDKSSLFNELDRVIPDLFDSGCMYNLSDCKLIVKKILSRKDDNKKRGYIGELLSHILLGELKFQRLFVFRNLEENSMKKGFDGLQEKNNLMRIEECKSTTRTDNNHVYNINKAVNDIKEKVTNFDLNDPWYNAMNHIQMINYKNDALKQQIAKLSRDFTNNISPKISELNFLPCSILFFDYDYLNRDNEVTTIVALLAKHEIKNAVILMIDTALFDSIIEYFGIKNE